MRKGFKHIIAKKKKKMTKQRAVMQNMRDKNL